MEAPISQSEHDVFRMVLTMRLFDMAAMCEHLSVQCKRRGGGFGAMIEKLTKASRSMESWAKEVNGKGEQLCLNG